MMLASVSLEQAVLAHLADDTRLTTLLGGKKIYREPRRNIAFPYLTLAVSPSRDWSTGTEKGEEHRLLIHVWTGADDRDLMQQCLARLSELIHLLDLDLTDHHLVNCRLETSIIQPDRKNRLLQGILQCRAVTEEA